ncbi:sensor histidine kinase [Leptospira stimsonii]|uniref:histidine kinase n=1 Tax=Leptospira stimsonii TaxID=2202203 RepID=A0A396Z014_9LEPT|nr:sensor histidine kinase [Leptospira stimsonii]RHX87076.1 sensor histidine kinase [Leptospira stimsonii]
MFFKKINQIYGRRDYLTRKKAYHLFVTDLVIFIVSIVACLLYIRQGVRVGFLIFAVSAFVSIVFLLINRLEVAIYSILYLSLTALTFGIFFGMQNGNIYFSMATIIILFLHFSNSKLTIAVSCYTGILMAIRMYQYWGKGELSSAFIFDTILKFILFCTLAIITVRVLTSHKKEKEVFIREIHHRVKNNLQILSGFANLHQNNGVKGGDKQLESFNERILMLSKIHDAIYKSETDYEIDLNKVLIEIVGLVRIQNGPPIELIQSKNAAPLSIEISVPFAMIVYELLNNAVRHSRQENRENRIVVELHFANHRYFLTVLDSGPGIQMESTWTQPKTTGFTLISIMTQQLKGNFRFDSNEYGSKAVLEFSNQDLFASLLQ